jgi:uncharacterized protein
MTVPLFPLPNVVLFPRAVLPLHIFEQRYREMTADALDGDRRIAMALLRPGWEQLYHARPAIEPVVCVGKILSHEQLPDGKYNFLLQGLLRARIREEVGDQSYRLAEVEVMQDAPVMEIDLSNDRFRLTNMFSELPFGAMPLARQMLQLLSGPLPTQEIADVMAFTLLEDIPLKQSLLEQTDCRARVAKVIAALEEMRPALSAKFRRIPPESSMN